MGMRACEFESIWVSVHASVFVRVDVHVCMRVNCRSSTSAFSSESSANATTSVTAAGRPRPSTAARGPSWAAFHVPSILWRSLFVCQPWFMLIIENSHALCGFATCSDLDDFLRDPIKDVPPNADPKVDLGSTGKPAPIGGVDFSQAKSMFMAMSGMCFCV